MYGFRESRRCMLSKTGTLGAGILLIAGCSYAQTDRPAFEVASVKRAPSRSGIALPSKADPSRIVYFSTTLKTLLMRAYDISKYQLDGPSWLNTEMYDIEAKVPEGASQKDVPAMLQGLLEERFGLKAHFETRIEPGYDLVIGKHGPKLEKVDESAPPMITDTTGTRVTGWELYYPGHAELGKTTMQYFARSLSRYMDETVIDATGLPGAYHILLEVDPTSFPGLLNLYVGRPSTAGSWKPSIFIAIQELGLKLEPRKMPVEHLVVDRVEKIPTDN